MKSYIRNSSWNFFAHCILGYSHAIKIDNLHKDLVHIKKTSTVTGSERLFWATKFAEENKKPITFPVKVYVKLTVLQINKKNWLHLDVLVVMQ